MKWLNRRSIGSRPVKLLVGLSFEIPLLCIILTVDSSQASRVLPIQLQKTTFNAIAAISWLQSEFWRVQTDIWDVGRGY